MYAKSSANFNVVLGGNDTTHFMFNELYFIVGMRNVGISKNLPSDVVDGIGVLKAAFMDD